MSKKTILAILSVPVPGLLLLFLLFVLLDWSETIERHFPDYQHLAQASEPGNWVPTFIPKSAKNIKTKNNIDTNWSLLAFHFDKLSELDLTGHCRTASVNDIEYRSGKFLTASWWPTAMLREGPSSNELAHYQIYRCGQNAFLVVNAISETPQAYFWRN